MKIGDVVIPAYPKASLRCGSGIYTHAIVISLEPFVLVSSTGDMRWESTVEAANFIPLCQASEAIIQIAMRRLNK